MNNHEDDPIEEEDVQNDAVIAIALRASLVVIMLLGLPVIAFLIYLNMNQAKQVSTEVEVTLPDERQSNEQEIPSLIMTDMRDSSGVEFAHESGREGKKLLPETMGSGTAGVGLQRRWPSRSGAGQLQSLAVGYPRSKRFPQQIVCW